MVVIERWDTLFPASHLLTATLQLPYFTSSSCVSRRRDINRVDEVYNMHIRVNSHIRQYGLRLHQPSNECQWHSKRCEESDNFFCLRMLIESVSALEYRQKARKGCPSRNLKIVPPAAIPSYECIFQRVSIWRNSCFSSANWVHNRGISRIILLVWEVLTNQA